MCNSRIKGALKFDEKTHIHPFIDDFDSIKRFSVNLAGVDYLKIDSFKIIFVDNTTDTIALAKANRSIEDFKLVARYKYHRSDVVDVFKRAKFYGKHRLTDFKSLLGNAELKEALFPEQSQEINQSPLSKLKKDILNILGR